jgi:hypothetical protein
LLRAEFRLHSLITTEKIMNKFLSIVAAAGLMTAFASAAQAQTTTFGGAGGGGTVGASCTVTTPTNAGLSATGTPPTSLSGTATATVTCNDLSGKSLTVALNTTNSTLNGETADAKLTGGTGNFSGITTPVASKSITATTPSTGDSATITTNITPTTVGNVLAAGTYTAIVDATITP